MWNCGFVKFFLGVFNKDIFEDRFILMLNGYFWENIFNDIIVKNLLEFC